jgi:hypothetical protein
MKKSKRLLENRPSFLPESSYPEIYRIYAFDEVCGRIRRIKTSWTVGKPLTPQLNFGIVFFII